MKLWEEMALSKAQVLPFPSEKAIKEKTIDLSDIPSSQVVLSEEDGNSHLPPPFPRSIYIPSPLHY